MINGIMSLKLSELTKKDPKGKALENGYAAAFDALASELKSEYPYKPKAKSMSYGSKGDAFGA